MTVIDFASFVDQLASVSGDTILPFFRTSLAIENKQAGGFDPVTAADRAAEHAMRALIRRAFPDHGILGEEYGPERTDAEYVWVLDPIDGTKAFLTGKPIFGTLIALVQGGAPILGIIDQPILRERWIGAAGRRTTLNGAEIAVRPCPRLDQAILNTTGPDLFPGDTAAGFARLSARVKRTLYGGDCYQYGLLSAGFIDLVAEAGLKPYDFCALVPVIEGAGGTVTDWRGERLTTASRGTIVAAGDAARHAEAVALLSGD